MKMTMPNNVLMEENSESGWIQTENDLKTRSSDFDFGSCCFSAHCFELIKDWMRHCIVDTSERHSRL